MRWQEVEKALVRAEGQKSPGDFVGPREVGWLQGREDTLFLLREVLDIPPELEGEAEEIEDSAA